MGKVVATLGDRVVGLDTHVVWVPSPAGPVPTPLPSPFLGLLDDDASQTVWIDGKAVALEGTRATNRPSHIPAAGPFQTPPTNRGRVVAGSDSTFIEGRAAARDGDAVSCCNDPSDEDTGRIVVVDATVFAG